jgi:P4 family phage/plasmid primase-like protien
VKDITRDINGEICIEVYNYMRWILGYALQGRPKQKKFFIFWGPEGYNGKSILLNTISDILEDYCVTMDKSVVLESRQKTSGSHSTELVRLENCRLGILSDTKENVCIDDGQIKQLTSITDKISVREIFGKQKEMRPTFVPIIATNYKIRVNLTDLSMYERLVLFPFWIRFLDNPTEKHHRKNDPDLADRFQNPEYKKSILCWLIDCSEFYNTNTKLRVPRSLIDAKNEYRRDMNVYLEFIDLYFDVMSESENIENRRNNWLRKSEVVEMFTMFCSENAIKYTPSKVQKELDKYLKSHKIDGINCYIGVTRKTLEDP